VRRLVVSLAVVMLVGLGGRLAVTVEPLTDATDDVSMAGDDVSLAPSVPAAAPRAYVRPVPPCAEDRPPGEPVLDPPFRPPRV
jgi:hypothetical protein